MEMQQEASQEGKGYKHPLIGSIDPAAYDKYKGYVDKICKMLDQDPEEQSIKDITSSYAEVEGIVHINAGALWCKNDLSLIITGEFETGEEPIFDLFAQHENMRTPYVSFNHMNDLEDIFLELVVKYFNKHAEDVREPSSSEDAIEVNQEHIAKSLELIKKFTEAIGSRPAWFDVVSETQGGGGRVNSTDLDYVFLFNNGAEEINLRWDVNGYSICLTTSIDEENEDDPLVLINALYITDSEDRDVVDVVVSMDASIEDISQFVKVTKTVQ